MRGGSPAGGALCYDAAMDMLRRLSGEATPLHGAAGQGAADLLRVLIDSGADANARDGTDNLTPENG